MLLPLHNIKNITKWITRSLVQDMVTCLNMSPLKNGISSDLTPVEIIIGSPNTYYNKLQITFGEYSQVCIGTTNSTKKITVVLIALRPDNEQVRHYFMSLATLKQLHAHIFTELTIL